MAKERYIENRVIRNRDKLGYADSAFIRRCRVGRDFGIVDLVLFPFTGRHRIVVIEAKQVTSADSDSKVVGQLLMYYTGFLHHGMRGIRYMQQFATSYPDSARSVRNKLLKTLSGGISPPDAAWLEMQRGRKVRPEQVSLYIALDENPSFGLKSSLSVLAKTHGLKIGVVSVPTRDKVKIWMPSKK